MAPELLEVSKEKNNPKSMIDLFTADVYSFGMTIF